MKTTKEEFDCEVRNMITEEQPADVFVEVLSQVSLPVGDEPIGANRSCAQELVLPDRTFVLARLMLAAWENNMDGAEENTAHIVIAATQIFIKNILTAIFTRRKGFNVQDQSFVYNIGEPVPSSWKRNTMFIPQCYNYNLINIMEPGGQIPVSKLHIEDAEQAKAFMLACSVQNSPLSLKPVSAVDLQHTLKVHKNLIDNHTIYATNMERSYTYAKHPTWEDIESTMLS